MRHDVDLCPDKALCIARIEGDLNVGSTYFFLVSSEFYNIFAPDSLRCLHAISSLGHEIGLHFDAAPYDHGPPAMDAFAEAECQALAAATGRPVEIISFHRPVPYLRGMPDNLGGRSHTYQPKYFNDIEYCSDSAGEWSHGHPFDRQAFMNGKALQLVTHPIWWADEIGLDPKERIRRFFAQRLSRVKLELRSNLTKGPFVGNWIEQIDI